MNRLKVFPVGTLICVGAFFLVIGRLVAQDIAELVADRTAIERVYHDHRVGVNTPFEGVLPRALLEELVRKDLRKEALLKEVYQVTITQDQIHAEVRRINETTRAPKILAELKSALVNDTNRFARAVARPIVVERLLRHRFDNDDALHAAERRLVEKTRLQLLQAQKEGGSAEQLIATMQEALPSSVLERIWQFATPPPLRHSADAGELAEIQKRFGPQARILSSPNDTSRRQQYYFDELAPELRQVLEAQLREPGDISAVIESNEGFQLYLLKERNSASLSAAVLFVPKRSYELWLEEAGK
jgi:hypothetical protein